MSSNVHLLSFLKRLITLSSQEPPGGSLLTFVPGDVSTRICTITAQRSLTPPSSTRTALGSPCGSLSQRERYGLTTFRLEKYVDLGACFRPGDVLTTKAQTQNALPVSIPFGSSVSTTFACFCLRSLSQIQIPSLYQLASTHPVLWLPGGQCPRGYRPAPEGASLHCPTRS